MQDKYLNKLEYNKILTILETFAKTFYGKKLCLELKPFTNKDNVYKKLSETKEALELINLKGNLPIYELEDVSLYIKELEAEQFLGTKALLDIANILSLSRNLKEYFKFDTEEETDKYPNLQNYFFNIYTNPNIENNIKTKILDENTIDDRASEKLYTIRKNKRKLEQEIKEKLNNFIHSSTYSKYIREPVITIRNDRFVIPVKDEYRSQIKGFIHDTSSSGSTVFIEPMNIFELNNQINNLKFEENIEIEKILQILSFSLFPIIEELKNNIRLIGVLDFTFAKANYAKSTNSICPTLNRNKFVNLIKARHPLIDKTKVVPIDINIGNEFTSLIITGPNTGGKTVTLKTFGLLSLMAMSGLFIPANNNSEVYVFDNIFADIGDEQSISDSLSTFSSHMVNIIDILNQVSNNSLVLLDELGSGTDPIEGSSLAISILEYLHSKKVLTIATTHYQELKNYTLTTNGFENASVEFDIEKMSPTYQLLIGIPGKSNAFEISKKLGLNENILTRAKHFINSDSQKIEDVIKNIYDNQIAINKEKELIEKNSNQIELLRKSLENDLSKTHEKAQDIIEKSKIEARNILLSAKEEVNYIIGQMNNLSSQDLKQANNLRNKLNNEIKKTASAFAGAETGATDIVHTKSVKKENLKIGQTIFVKTLNQEAIILSISNKNDEIQVQIGSIKTKINIKDILKIIKNEKEKTTVSANFKSNIKNKNIPLEINIIGMNVLEAEPIIDKYLDDCIQAKFTEVRIVHGKGSGKLREGVHEFLKKHPHVKSFRLGTFGEGEMGATVVSLK